MENSSALRRPVRIEALHTAVTSQTDPTTESKKLPPVSYPKLQTLLVDDNPTNRMVAERLLFKKRGFTPDTADNGVQALAKLKEKNYDLIFMDCRMPEMDGYETTRRIRRGEVGEHNKNIPIIAMTASAMQSDREECRLAGMSDHISKPLYSERLDEILEAWIKSEPNDEARKSDPLPSPRA